MAERTGKDYNALIEYVESRVLDGTFELGDKLPPERELAQTLHISRSAIREGLRILEVIGVIYPLQGSGNYIANDYDQTLVQIVTMMFALEKMSDRELREYRYAIEFQALSLAVSNISKRDKLRLRQYLKGMEAGKDDAEKALNDKLIHRTIVEASGNRLVIANYLALNKILERQIVEARARVKARSKAEEKRFQKAHKDLVEAVCDGNVERCRAALDDHFAFVMDDFDT